MVPGIKKFVRGITVIQQDMGEVEATGKNRGSAKKSSTKNRLLGNIHMQSEAEIDKPVKGTHQRDSRGSHAEHRRSKRKPNGNDLRSR